MSPEAKRVFAFNPTLVSDNEAKAHFVARQPEFQMLCEAVRDNVSPSNQHVLVSGPRGSGKTSLLNRMRIEIQQTELSDRWIPVQLPEENYKIVSSKTFWLSCLKALGHQVAPTNLAKQLETYRAIQDDDAQRNFIVDCICSAARDHERRIVFLIENIHDIFNFQFGRTPSARDIEGWRLRNTLQTRPEIMLIASTVNQLPNLEQTEEPFYGFFQSISLKPISGDEIANIWQNFTEAPVTLDEVRPIEIITGGNLRLITILASFERRIDVKFLMEGIQELIENYTNYFKGIIEGCGREERSVFSSILESWDPIELRTICIETDLDAQNVNTAANRLIQRGYVKRRKINGGRAHYEASERLFNLYYLIRNETEKLSRVKALIRFMSDFYKQRGNFGQFIEQALQEDFSSLNFGVEEQYFLTNMLEQAAIETNLWSREAIRGRGQHSDIDVILEEIRDQYTKQDVNALLKSLLSQQKSNAPKKGAKKVAEYYLDLNERDQALAATELRQHLTVGETLSDAFKADVTGSKLATSMDQLTSNRVNPWIILAKLLSKSLDVETVQQLYLNAISSSDVDANAFVEYGLFLSETSKGQADAIEMFERAVEIDGQNWVGWWNLAVSHSSQRQSVSKASNAFSQAIELNPDHPELLRDYARFLIRTRDIDRALRVIGDIRNTHGDDTELLCLEGAALIDQKRPDKAVSSLESVLAIEPANVNALENLGLAYFRLGRFEEAIAPLQRGVEIEPKNVFLLRQLGRAHYNSGRSSTGIRFLERAYRLDRNDKYSVRYYATCLLDEGKIKSAQKIVARGLKSHDDDGFLRGVQGQILFDLKRYPEAIKVLRAVVDEENGRSPFVRSLLMSCHAAGGWARTRREATRLIERHGDTNDFLLNSIAWSLFIINSKASLALGFDLVRKAVEVKPTNMLAHHTYGRIAAALGKHDDAVTALRTITKSEKGPKFVREITDLTVELALNGFGSQAYKVIERANHYEELEPLTIALRQQAGESILVAAEVQAVVDDIIARMQ